MEFLSQKPCYSTDPSTKGFDLSSGNKWIYPENYPLREYQFQIVNSALYHNTLVCLPTGLGKTFVAAVVMYNFWRWYPTGKIVFLAPTKPLVAQQINACHDIMGIPSNETVELTGATDQKKRQIAWLQNSVIFATPQVFQKDLEKNIVPSDRVKCVVVDEAHKALGRHSYCESIRLLSEQNQYFRVLALSATPGGKLDAVQEVVRNLHITHMELRDDRSPDIIPYINERKLDIVLVGLGAELDRFKDRYITIMDRHVRILVENNVLRGFAGNISKGRIFHLQKEWQQKTNRGPNHGKIMKALMILMTMYHAYELMIRHGLRAFYNFYQNHMDKFWISDEQELQRLLEEINYYLGPFPDVRPMPDGTVAEIPEDIRFGHNKFKKLKEILSRHFEAFEGKEEETRAIVFVEYRDIVNEVYVLLLQLRPLIRPQKFMGQAGQKQKQQKLALEDFRSNKVNVLISTSVGEEGLDVGEVDLIVCFDISQQSPIRLVQRMGRTGRKRDGHIVVLVTDGKEHQTLKSTMSRRDSLNEKVLHSSGIINALHEESPRMVPPEFNPECLKMVMSIVPKVVPAKGKGKTKEPKKPRKRMDANSKTKNPKLPEPSTSSKPGTQSSLMRFFKKPAEEPMEIDDDLVPVTINEIPSLSVTSNQAMQSSQQSLRNNNAIKLSEVMLLSSDDAAVEFLTLCTMKRSENEQTYNDKSRTNPYYPSYYTKTEKDEDFFNFKVPDLKILNCLKNITDCVVPPIENVDDLLICEPTNRFNGYTDFYASTQNEILEEHSKFEALLDESSDSDVIDSRPKEINDFPADEQVDWGADDEVLGFEDILDEWSDESRKSVGNNLPVNKSDHSPRQSPNNLLDQPGVFEDILDSSTDENATDCELPNINCKPVSPKEKTSTKNPTDTNIENESKGAFEDILNISSDESDTDCSLQNVNVKSKTSDKEAPPTDPTETKIDSGSKGAFEDILNISSDESETDCSLQDVNVKSKNSDKEAPSNNPKETRIDSESKGSFEDILNISSDESETDCSLQDVNVKSKNSDEEAPSNNPKETRIDSESKGDFEDILNISSDESETDCSLSNVNADSKTPQERASQKNPIEKPIDDESKGAFEDILNSSSDESETDCSLQFEPDVPHTSKQISATKKPIELSIDNRSRDFPQFPKRIGTPRMSTEIDESADLLIDWQPKEIPQFPAAGNEPRNFKTFSVASEPSTSNLPKNSPQVPSAMLTLSQMLCEVERIHSIDNKHNETKVNKAAEGQIEDERSTSPVFPDRPRASWTSRLSGTSIREPARESQTHDTNQAAETAESEEDIFGTDDFMVDLDFEEKINNIERSVVENVNTVDELKSCESSAKNTNDKRAGTAFEKNCSNKIHTNSRSEPKTKFSDCGSGEGKKELCFPARTSIVSESNADDFEWDSEGTKNSPTVKESAPDTVDLANCDWRIVETKNSIPQTSKELLPDTVDFADCSWSVKKARKSFLPAAKETLPDTVDLDNYWSNKEAKKSTVHIATDSAPEIVDLDSYWSNKEAKKSTVQSAKESAPDTVDIDDCDWDAEVLKNPDDGNRKSEVVKNPTPPSVKDALTDIVPDDFDWGSDFETFSSPLKPSTSFQKSPASRESPKCINNSLNDKKIGHIDTTDWISTAKPKVSLSLGKKLTNIRKSLLTRQICSKLPATKQDSDSENEFAVGRLETTLTTSHESHFFAKPDPVDKTTSSGSLGMSHPRRIIRRPLSLRRNDGNKLSIDGLSSFAAPNKYTQQQQTRNNLSVGAGRQKSASLDLDSRKKKKKHRDERRRVRVRSEFVDDEAEVSSDGDHTSGTSGTDDDLEGFVSYTQGADDSVDMRAHYLQTLKSPPHRPGRFHFREPKSLSPDVQIYSQAPPDGPNEYLYDSFCVAEGDDDVFENSETPDEISILDEMEMSRRSKKRKRVQSTNTRANLRRKIITPNSDTSSSEDELEKMRQQIHEESFVLKNRRK